LAIVSLITAEKWFFRSHSMISSWRKLVTRPSAAVNRRPRRSGMSMAAKYSGEATRWSAPGSLSRSGTGRSSRNQTMEE
jgi:hypothetical protein